MKTYQTDTPLNSAAITPRKEFVILGGGQEARDVTTTSSRQGKFEARFFHKIFEEEIGRVRGHFGPLNTVESPPRAVVLHYLTRNRLLYTHKALGMHLAEKMAMCACIISTSHTLTLLMRSRRFVREEH